MFCPGQEFLLLLAAHLDQCEVGEAGVDPLFGRGGVAGQIRATRHQFPDVVVVTWAEAASKDRGSGSSGITCQPVAVQRHSLRARSRATSPSVS